MTWPAVAVDKTIEFLNQLLELDPVAVSALVERRVPCNEALAVHPTVQVCSEGSEYRVGLLGVLNGLFGVDQELWGPISAQYNEDDLERVVGFVRTDEPDVRG